MRPIAPEALKPADPQLPTTRTFNFDSTADPASAQVEGLATPVEQIARFQIRRPLGQGGFGSVYLAYDPTLAREVALKIPRPAIRWSQAQIEAFLEEARTAARLKHPHVITIYDAGACQEHGVFIAMEYVAGETLADRLKRGKLTVGEAIRICDQVADALHQGHKLGLVHRDLKPANILIDEEGNAKVCDFGLAIDEADQQQRRGEVSGTWHYMSPEQLQGDSHLLDGRSDLWSLGVVLYECLAGRRPYRGANWEEIRQDVLTRDPKPLRQLDDSIPAALDQLCRRCLERDLAKRIRTATDFRGALTSAERRPVNRRSIAIVASGIALLGLALAVALAVAFGRGRLLETGPRTSDVDIPAETPRSTPTNATAMVQVKSLVKPNGQDNWHVQLDGGALHAETQAVDLLSFGALRGEEELEIELRQVRWTGGIGIFYGHRPSVVDGTPSQSFQALVVASDLKGGWRIIRAQYRYPIAKADVWSGQNLSSTPLSIRDNQTLKLRLNFVAGHLVKVTADGRDLTDSIAGAPSESSAADATGQYGLLLDHSSGTVAGLSINSGRALFQSGKTPATAAH